MVDEDELVVLAEVEEEDKAIDELVAATIEVFDDEAIID